MKIYDVYHRTTPPRLIRKGLTEQQMDLLWSELKWWQKTRVIIKARELNTERDMEK